MEDSKYLGAETKLGSFVYIARGVMSPENCRRIINEYKDDPMFEWAGLSMSTTDPSWVDHETRKVRELLITHPSSWMWSEDRVEIGKSVQASMQNAVNMYFKHLEDNKISSFAPTISGDEGFKLLHYANGYHFKEHFDQVPASARAFTCSLNLSSGYEGGSFEFFGGTATAHLGVGDAVIFPSNFMFPHAVTPITSGERYSVITWLF